MVAEPEAPPSPASPPAGLGPPDTRDLALALAHIGGVPDLTLTDAAASLLSAVGDAGRYVFVLVDGLGAAMLEHLAPEGFLQRNSVLSLRAVCPTGTTAALSTLATGLWPAEHGLAGWWTSLPDLGLTATVPTTRSRDGLRDLGGSAATARLFSVPLLANASPKSLPPTSHVPLPAGPTPASSLEGARPGLTTASTSSSTGS